MMQRCLLYLGQPDQHAGFHAANIFQMETLVTEDANGQQIAVALIVFVEILEQDFLIFFGHKATALTRVIVALEDLLLLFLVECFALNRRRAGWSGSFLCLG